MRRGREGGREGEEGRREGKGKNSYIKPKLVLLVTLARCIAHVLEGNLTAPRSIVGRALGTLLVSGIGAPNVDAVRYIGAG